MGTPFDRDAADRVLRRAIELADRDHDLHGAEAVSEQALVEAAEELGVEVGAVRRAAAEERLGVLDTSAHLVDRVAGPAVVSATRVVEAAAPVALEQVDLWLRRSGTLRRRRLDAARHVAEYARRSDVVAGLQRTARSVSGREHLVRVRRLRAVVQPVDEGRSVVALVADLEVERTVAVVGGSSVAGVGSSVSVIEALGSTPWWWLGVPASVVAGLGLLRARARGVPDVETELQGVLDRVVAGDVPSGVLQDVRGRLFGGTGRSRPG